MEYTKGEAVKLSENFKSTEFDCKGANCCNTTKISKQLVTYLQLIRNHFGKAVRINSGYRCAKHNAAVGGARASKHMQGQAADIKVSGVEPKEVAKYAESIGIKGIGLYDSFVHIDTRTSKFFWYGSNEEPRTTFGGTVVNKDLVTEEQKPKEETENLIKEWQLAAIADGFKFPKYGADGKWGAECAGVAKRAVVKQRLKSQYYNLTKLAQKLLGIATSGICDGKTDAAIREYQKQQQLKADGAIGINTWRVLLNQK